MKKLLLCLFFMCLGLTFQVQAGVVEMTKENTSPYYLTILDDLSICDKVNSINYSMVGNALNMTKKEGANDSDFLQAVNFWTRGSGGSFVMMAYCVANGKFSSATFRGPYELGNNSFNGLSCANYPGNCDIKIFLSGDSSMYYASVQKKTCTSLRVKSSNIKSSGVINIIGWNSPFLYTQNSPFQNLQITINSPFNDYHNQLPAFNLKNGWQVIADNNKFIVEQKPQNHLFYELSMNKITLNRNGQNFASKTDLTNYLQNSDFFTKLGLNEIQKANSLNYILPQLPIANNYYLTILSNSAIQEISELNINPAPKQLNRIYYAIYPTANPVKINGDLIFPSINSSNEFTILESGEILVKPEMFVFWK